MEYITLAVTCGLSAGLSPGPLMTVIISEAVKHGKKEGLKVALAPLLTDLPIVIISIFILSRITNSGPVLGVVSLLGGLYLLYLGCQNIGFQGTELKVEDVPPQSIRKGVITNFLSPNPYMFWMSIGAPTVLRSFRENPFFAICFLSIFYVLLMGSKFAIAIAAAKSRRFLKSDGFIYTCRGLGFSLWLFGFYFLYEAYRQF